MPDELIIGLTLLIVVLTVIGLAVYGLIALIARLFAGPARRGNDTRRCAFCGKMTPSDQDRCDWCSRDLRSPLAAELTDLDALERQLQRFRDSRPAAFPYRSRAQRKQTYAPTRLNGMQAQRASVWSQNTRCPLPAMKSARISRSDRAPTLAS